MREKDRYKETTLPNGLKVLTYQMDSVLAAAAILFIKVGAIYEKEEERGVTHFCEHAAFLGTGKYDSYLKISRAAQKIGAVINGDVTRLYCNYRTNLPHAHLKGGVDLLYELSFKPVLKEKEIIKERSVILSEFNDFWHNPDARFGYEVWRRRFKQKEHPYSFRPLGKPETIEKIDKKLIESWMEKYFHPTNMVLSIAGRLEEKSILPVIKKKFEQDKSSLKPKEPKFKTNDYSNFSVYLYPDPRPQINFVLSFPAFGRRERKRKERLRLKLLSHILGGDTASRLFHSLREKEKFVYDIQSNTVLYPWMGVLEIWGSVPKENLIKTLQGIKKEIDKLVRLGVNFEEMKLAKNFLSASTLIEFDSPNSIANYFAYQALNEEKIWFPQDYNREAKKITRKELNLLAKQIFDYSKINLSFLGDVSQAEIRKIKKIFSC